MRNEEDLRAAEGGLGYPEDLGIRQWLDLAALDRVNLACWEGANVKSRWLLLVRIALLRSWSDMISLEGELRTSAFLQRH
jgi:hypothetical protein